jgi:hypothetical protein
MKNYVIRYVNGARLEISKQVANACGLYSGKKRAKMQRKAKVLAHKEELRWQYLQEATRAYKEDPTPENWDIYSDLHKDYWGVRPLQ